MAKIKNFEDLTIWKESRSIVDQVYKITRLDSFSEDVQLVNHIRRTAISVPSNISEGFERDGTREFINFLSIAKGSCGELISQLYIALDQKYLDQDMFTDLNNQIIKISRSIGSLINYLQKCEHKGIKYKS